PQPEPEGAAARVERRRGAGGRQHGLLDHVGHVGGVRSEQARDGPPDPLGVRLVQRPPGLGLSRAQPLDYDPLLLLIHKRGARRGGSFGGVPVRLTVNVSLVEPRLLVPQGFVGCGSPDKYLRFATEMGRENFARRREPALAAFPDLPQARAARRGNWFARSRCGIQDSIMCCAANLAPRLFAPGA